MASENPSAVEESSMAVMASEAVEKNSEGKKEKKKKKNPKMLKFNKYIYKVLKKVHPDIGISGEAVKMMNNIISNTMMKIFLEASYKKSKKKHAGPMLNFAVREVFPKEMAELAISAGVKSVNTYMVDLLSDVVRTTMFI